MKKHFSFLTMKSLLKWRLLVIFVILVIPFILGSCWKDRFDFANISTPDSWNPDVCAPLIHSNLIMKDILNDYDYNNLFVEDETGFLYLVYWDRVFSQTAGEFLAIQDQDLNTSFPFSVAGPLPFGGDVTAPPYTHTYSFTMPGGEILDKTILNMPGGGSFVFNINSPDLNHDATINVSIPTATLGGVAFNQNIDFTAGVPLTTNFDLSGYQIDFNPGNSIDVIYTVTLHGSGLSNNSPYTFNMNESFKILSFHAIYGDFKQRTFSLPNDSVNIRIFDHNVYGMINFENPKVYLWAYNSLGLPINVSLNNLRATSDANSPYLVTLTGIPNPWYINGPSLLQIGQTISTTYTIDKTNSNLKDALDISPQFFVADIGGMANPAGGISSNFAIDTNRLSVEMQVELPLHGRAWDFRLSDTIDFSFGTDVKMDMLEFMSFRTNTENGFPVDGTLQIYFLDEFNNVLDSLYVLAAQLISAAPVGAPPDYRVTQSVLARTETEIRQPRLTALEPTQKIVVLAKLATISNGNQIVKIYTDYNLDVRLGARAKFIVNF